MARDKSRAEIRKKKKYKWEGKKKKLWFFIFPLKHKLLSKEIFKSQKLLRSEPKLEPTALAQDSSGDEGFWWGSAVAGN